MLKRFTKQGYVSQHKNRLKCIHNVYGKCVCDLFVMEFYFAITYAPLTCACNFQIEKTSMAVK